MVQGFVSPKKYLIKTKNYYQWTKIHILYTNVLIRWISEEKIIINISLYKAKKAKKKARPCKSGRTFDIIGIGCRVRQHHTTDYKRG